MNRITTRNGSECGKNQVQGNLTVFNFTCQGESHKLINKVCQDASTCYLDNNMAITVVCDGHGGASYFRSEIGAELLCKITKEKILEFIKYSDLSLLSEYPFVQAGPVSDIDGNITEIDIIFRHLFASIITSWNKSILEHSQHNPLSSSEVDKLFSMCGDDENSRERLAKSLDNFNKGMQIERAYGSTLLAAVRTESFWFAFQIGDGKIISLDISTNPLWQEPVPWDELCHLNKTTSICDESAIDEFRYCFQGNKSFPMAIFMGSDGMDDSLHPIEKLADFYINVAKSICTDGIKATNAEIKRLLPSLSQIGSKDDMSLAYIADIDSICKNYKKLISYQIATLDAELKECSTKISKKENALLELEEKLKPLTISITNIQIEHDVILKDIEEISDKKNALTKKISIMQEELNNKSYYHEKNKQRGICDNCKVYSNKKYSRYYRR